MNSTRRTGSKKRSSRQTWGRFQVDEQISLVRTRTHTVIPESDPDFHDLSQDWDGVVSRRLRIWLAPADLPSRQRASAANPQPTYLGCLHFWDSQLSGTSSFQRGLAALQDQESLRELKREIGRHLIRYRERLRASGPGAPRCL